MSNPMEVKLSKGDIETLQSVFLINQSVRINANNKQLRVMDVSKTRAVLAELSTEIPRQFCIYDVREFLQVLNLFKDPILDFSHPTCVIVKSEDNTQRVTYMDASVDMIKSYYEKDIPIGDPDVEVEVTGEQLDLVMKATSSMRLDFIGFRSVNGKIVLTAFNPKTKSDGANGESSNIVVELGDTDAEFDLFYSAASLNVLNGDCKFQLTRKCLSRVENSGRVYFITMSKDSTFSS